MLTRDHTVLPATHTFIHKWNEPSCRYSPPAQSVTALWPVLIFRPAEGRRLSWSEWLVTNRGGLLPADGHPSITNRARRRVTSLIEANVLPLNQAGTYCGRVMAGLQVTSGHRITGLRITDQSGRIADGLLCHSLAVV